MCARGHLLKSLTSLLYFLEGEPIIENRPPRGFRDAHTTATASVGTAGTAEMAATAEIAATAAVPTAGVLRCQLRLLWCRWRSKWKTRCSLRGELHSCLGQDSLEIALKGARCRWSDLHSVARLDVVARRRVTVRIERNSQRERWSTASFLCRDERTLSAGTRPWRCELGASGQAGYSRRAWKHRCRGSALQQTCTTAGAETAVVAEAHVALPRRLVSPCRRYK